MTDKEILEIINSDEGLKKAIVKIDKYKKDVKKGFVELIIKNGKVVDSNKKDKL